MKIEISEAERQLLIDAVNNECKRIANDIAKEGAENDPFSKIVNKGRRDYQLKYEELFDKLIILKGDNDATGNTARKGSPPSKRKPRGETKPSSPDRGTRADDRAAD